MNKIFLDDLRDPPDQDWVVIRSYANAVSYMSTHGIPEFISFDHDLGLEETGYDLAKWMVEMDLTKKILIPINFSYSIHSANPIGRKNIDCLLDNYLSYRHRMS